MISCPACREEMRSVVEFDVEIDVCDACSSIWLDPGELNKVAKSGENTVTDVVVNETPGEFVLWCPGCGGDDFCKLEVMTHMQAVHIDVARCSGCGGIFVDNDNLDRLRGQIIPARPSAATEEVEVNTSEEEEPNEPGIATQLAVDTVGNGILELLIHVICAI